MPGDVFDKANPDGIFPVLARVEQNLGLSAEFCEQFINEDDWSFIIKLHALLETALTAAIVRKLDHPELEQPLANLPTSEGKAGKVAFAESLGLLNRDERRAIQNLSRIRNKCAHHIREVSFDLKRYVAELKSDDRKDFLRDFAFYGLTDVTPSQRLDVERSAIEKPKLTVWRTGLVIVAILTMQAETSEYQRASNAALLESAKMLSSIYNSPPSSIY